MCFVITDYVNLLLGKFYNIQSQRLILTPHTVSRLAQRTTTMWSNSLHFLLYVAISHEWKGEKLTELLF